MSVNLQSFGRAWVFSDRALENTANTAQEPLGASNKQNTANADALLKTGASPQNKDLPADQQAATAVLINAIMNLDEAVTKR